MQDITLDVPVDTTLQLEQVFLNKNLRDAMLLMVAPPTCILQKTDTQTFTGSSAWNAISWNTKVSDSEDPASPIFAAGNPTRMTCRTDGWYEISANVPMQLDAVGNTFTVALRVNGNAALIYAGDSEGVTGTALNHAVSFSTIIPMVATDYVEVLFRMTRGVNLTSVVYAGAPRVVFRRVRGT